MNSGKLRKHSRRELLQLLAAGGAALVLNACRVTPDPPPAGTTPTPAILPPTPTAPAGWQPPTTIRITPNDDFYTMKFHPSRPPEVDPDSYRLEISGEVDTPLSLSLADLKAFPAVTEMRTLECISNPVGGNLMGNATWTGLSMAALLAAAGVRPAGKHLKLESLDSYHTGIPIELAMDEHALLVYEMNGETLPAKHGYPLRCLWPGRYGQKQPKWIQRITVQRQPHLGHFEAEGWSDEAIILPNARIEQPPPRQVQPADFYVAGVAFYNDSGLEAVDVSLDNGATWQPAELLRGPSARTWTEWWLLAENASTGTMRVLARVTDGSGRVQALPRDSSSLLSGTFPNGTDEMHRVVVQVKNEGS